ncbi:hypothetical protein SDC9_105608 [bioreactor metagenome]|uniref:Uncharacterized protein n=1 Tax=bioreactor metagenome TaxID=1076179 RepID=A0A645AZX3_9ZZZZ
MRIADGGDVVGGDVPGGEHSVQRSVLIGHGNGLGIGVLMNHAPRPADGDTGAEQRRRVIREIVHLGPHVFQQHGRLKAKAVQHSLSFIVYPAEARRRVFPVPQGIAQGGIGHGGDNGVRVGVAVPGDIDGVHANIPFTLRAGWPGWIDNGFIVLYPLWGYKKNRTQTFTKNLRRKCCKI